MSVATATPCPASAGRRAVGSRTLAAVLALSLAFAAGCATVGVVETIEALLKQIQDLLSAKKWDEALAKVAELLRREPTQWRAYLYGARAYIGKADWSQALASARKAFDLAPREGET